MERKLLLLMLWLSAVHLVIRERRRREAATCDAEQGHFAELLSPS
jgi:hypothetical protein